MLKKLKQDLKKASDKKQAALLQRFFKTSEGQYGAGDVFLGIKVPIQRAICKNYGSKLTLDDIQELLNDNIHEHRLCALFALVAQYKKADEKQKKKIYRFYLKNTKRINNWDLVDLSAHKIVGDYLLDKDRKILYKLAKSKNLWEKRISIISTFAFIAKGQLKDSIKISELLLKDKHDLIHKAVGWVLREVGKKDVKVLEKFIQKHYKDMPRTMLRYSIEKFPEKKRKKYLIGKW
jgi:3-methyladenine DNA glycosylase AlkD